MMGAEEYLGKSRLFRRLKRGPTDSSLSSTQSVLSKTGLFNTARGGASAWWAIS
jgi:hypothetical protein